MSFMTQSMNYGTKREQIRRKSAYSHITEDLSHLAMLIL